MEERDSKYDRILVGLCGGRVSTDVYRVLTAFCVTSSSIAHAIKKLLCAGLRGVKGEEQDYREAIKSIEARLLEMKQNKGV